MRAGKRMNEALQYATTFASTNAREETDGVHPMLTKGKALHLYLGWGGLRNSLLNRNVERNPAPPVEIKISLYAVKNVCSRISEQNGNRPTIFSNKELQTSFTMSTVIDRPSYFNICGNMEELFSQCSANLRSCPQPFGRLRK